MYITVQKATGNKQYYRIDCDGVLWTTGYTNLGPNWDRERIVLQPDAKERLIKQALEYEARR